MDSRLRGNDGLEKRFVYLIAGLIIPGLFGFADGVGPEVQKPFLFSYFKFPGLFIQPAGKHCKFLSTFSRCAFPWDGCMGLGRTDKQPFCQTGTERGDQAPRWGGILLIIQWQPDGSWKIAREIWNDTPPPETE
jgi:hypothetical protein